MMEVCLKPQPKAAYTFKVFGPKSVVTTNSTASTVTCLCSKCKPR